MTRSSYWLSILIFTALFLAASCGGVRGLSNCKFGAACGENEGCAEKYVTDSNKESVLPCAGGDAECFCTSISSGYASCDSAADCARTAKDVCWWSNCYQAPGANGGCEKDSDCLKGNICCGGVCGDFSMEDPLCA